MSDFKVNGSTPEEGKLKLGSSDIKRIYKGNVWVWPPADNSYTPTSPETNFQFLTNVQQTTNTAQGLPEGFGIYDTFGNNIAPDNPFGALPTFQNYHDANFTHYRPMSPESKDRYTIRAASTDYRYMIAQGHLKNGFYYYGGYYYFPSYDNYYLGNTVDTLIFSNDYGQTWNDLPITLNPLNTDEYFNGYTNFAMSDTGQIIIVEYETRYGAPNDSQYTTLVNFGFATHMRQESDKIVLISRDYGQTFEQLNNQLNPNASYSKFVPVFYGPPFQYNTKHFLVGNKTCFDSIKMSSTGKYILVGQRSSYGSGNTYYFDEWYLSSNFGHSFVSLKDTITNNLVQSHLYSRNVAVKDRIAHISISGNGKVFYFSSDKEYMDIYSADYGQTWSFIMSPRGERFSRNSILDFEGDNLLTIYKSGGGNVFLGAPIFIRTFNWQSRPELPQKVTNTSSFQHTPNYNREFLISQTGKFSLIRLVNDDSQNNNFHFFKNFASNAFNDDTKGSVLNGGRRHLVPIRILNT